MRDSWERGRQEEAWHSRAGNAQGGIGEATLPTKNVNVRFFVRVKDKTEAWNLLTLVCDTHTHTHTRSLSIDACNPSSICATLLPKQQCNESHAHSLARTFTCSTQATSFLYTL